MKGSAYFGLAMEIKEVFEASDKIAEYREELAECIKKEITSEVFAQLDDLKQSLQTLNDTLQQTTQEVQDEGNQLDDILNQVDAIFARPGGGAPLNANNPGDFSIIENRLNNTDFGDPDDSRNPGDDILIVPPDGPGRDFSQPRRHHQRRSEDNGQPYIVRTFPLPRGKSLRRR